MAEWHESMLTGFKWYLIAGVSIFAVLIIIMVILAVVGATTTSEAETRSITRK